MLKERLAEIERLRDRLREPALRDPLTGSYHRGHLEITGAKELARCRRDGIPVTQAMDDVDFFELINDTHGHPAGDQVLKVLAALLNDQARASDSPCRHGGEEFALLLPRMDAEAAMTRANP